MIRTGTPRAARELDGRSNKVQFRKGGLLNPASISDSLSCHKFFKASTDILLYQTHGSTFPKFNVYSIYLYI